MNRSLRRLAAAMLAAFAIVALALGYWSLVRGGELLAREDNPRRILDEQRVRRGTIYDRNGRVLAETVVNPDTGLASREYVSPSVAPVVGYYSLRFGVGGVEAAQDDFLRGVGLLDARQELVRDLLHEPPVGGDVRLTIDLDVQGTAARLLEGQAGAVVVLSVPEGEVLALASAPSFDPNELSDRWDELIADPDAPLLNRATQGLYQPGEILQSVILGAALNSGSVSVDDEWFGPLSASVDNLILPCAGDSLGVETIGDAFIAACPAPFDRMATDLGEDRVLAALRDFGLLSAPALGIPTDAVTEEEVIAADDPGRLAVGQGGLTVSPLQMALVAAAYADHGRMPPVQLIEARRAPDGPWQEVEASGNPRGTLSRASAEAMVELMGRAADEGVASAAAVGQSRVYGHAGLALSGPEATTNAWFIGFMRAGDGRAVAAAVLLENSADVSRASHIGGEVLRSALNAIR